jgi:Sec-independent protein secretion pathway component TatC
LLAIPIYILYESGLLLARLLLADRLKEDQAGDEEKASDATD